MMGLVILEKMKLIAMVIFMNMVNGVSQLDVFILILFLTTLSIKKLRKLGGPLMTLKIV